MKTLPRFLMLVAALLLCSADEVMDWLRLGTNAHRRGDYATALKWYDQAALTTTDPGQVAYQQAATHAALQEDEQAAAAYQRCLEDAIGPRRVLALYGRGNALAQAGNKRKGKMAVAQLRNAVDYYEQSLRAFQQLPPEEQGQCPGHEANLAYNLAIVRSVLAVKEKEPPEDTLPEEKNPPENPDPTPGDRNPSGSDPRNGDGENQQPTRDRRPGKGQLPMLKDDKGAAPLTAEQAQEYLQQTMERLQQQRGGQGGEGMKSGARDW